MTDMLDRKYPEIFFDTALHFFALRDQAREDEGSPEKYQDVEWALRNARSHSDDINERCISAALDLTFLQDSRTSPRHYEEYGESVWCYIEEIEMPTGIRLNQYYG